MKKNLILLVFSLVFSLILPELILRSISFDSKPLNSPKSGWAVVPERVWTEYHPTLGWAHQKSKEAAEGSIHINAQGFRGLHDYSETKPEGVRRVLALGDSFVFGFGVRDEETFSAVLEKKYPDLEVINAGVAGYGLDQIFLTFPILGKTFKPDSVLIGIFPEDFWRATRAFTDTGHAKPYFSLSSEGRLTLNQVPVPQPFTLTTGQYPQVIEYGALENFLRQSVLYRFVKRAVIKTGKIVKLTDPNSTEEWILGRAILKQLVREIRNSGAEPLIVIIPPDRWMATEQWDVLRQALIEFAQKDKVRLLDLTPDFQRAVQTQGLTHYYIAGDGHWTAAGHDLVADLIAAFLYPHG